MKLSVIHGSSLCWPSPTPLTCARSWRPGARLHGALRCAGAAGGVDQQRQRVVVIGDERLRGRQCRSAFESIGQRLHNHRAARLRQPRLGGFQRLALVVDLGVVVEHDQPCGRVRGQDQFDGVVEIVDARSDHARLGLGDDGSQLGNGRAGLQRNGHRADQDQRHVDSRVVDAGEAQRTDPIAGPHRMVACQGGRDRADAVPQLAVGDGLEPGQQLDGCAARLRSLTNSDGALPERGAVRIALHHRSHELRQSQPGLLDRRGDRLAGPGVGELLVGGVQIGDAAREPLFTSINRHQRAPFHITSCSYVYR